MAEKTCTENLESDLESPIRPAKKPKLEDSPNTSSNSFQESNLTSSEVLASSDDSFEKETKTKTKPNILHKKASDHCESNENGTTLIQTSLMGERAVYKELSLIGDGAYGTVYKARDAATGQVVALKKVRVSLTEDGLPTNTLREIAALKQLDRFDHPHIVKLLDVCQGNYVEDVADISSQNGLMSMKDPGLTLWLVFEHVEHDLAAFISSYKTNNIDPNLVRQISKEIILGADFLHSHRIIHRDLKPQNILINKEGKIKIADFGLAKTYDFEMTLTSVVVTLWYRAPEVLLGLSYASPIDIWAIGCILAELNRLSPLFPGTSEGDQLDKIFRIIGTPPEKDWPEKVPLSLSAFPQRFPTPLKQVIPNLNDAGLDLIKNMLAYNSHCRLTAAQALKHPYFL